TRGAADDDRVEDRRSKVEEPPFAAGGERDPRGEESADDQGQPAEQAAGGDPAPQQHDEERRPEEIEVLLDRERPQLPEAALLVQDSGREEGVREVENPGDRGQQRPCRVVPRSDAGRGLGDEDQQVRRDRHEERRQQPQRASPPELPQRDGSRSVPLLEQEGRDEESAQDEEDVDAEEGAVRPASEVPGEDEQDRDAADAVERRSVAEP